MKNTLLKQFKEKRVLILGEPILDSYLKGTSHRICKEAPVPIVDVAVEQQAPGGTGNVVMNVHAMGGRAQFLTVIGTDSESQKLRRIFDQTGISTELIIQNPDRQTLFKRRIIADGQLVVRYDQGTTSPLAVEFEKIVMNLLSDNYKKVDAILISDYGYGLLTTQVLSHIANLQKKHNKLLLVDSKYPDRYKNVQPSLIKFNYQECINLLSIKPAYRAARIPQLLEYADTLFKLTGAQSIAATVDAEGSLIFQKGKPYIHVPTEPVDVVKGSGAGDTYMSAFTLSLASGASHEEAAKIAAAAAVVVIKKGGTAACTYDDLYNYLNGSDKQILNYEYVEQLSNYYKQLNKKMVFTNGYFDIINPSHLKLLNTAKTFGDILIVGINTDESARRKLGAGRPFHTLSDRLKIVSALDVVTHVVPFAEDNSSELVRIIKPDVYVKGNTYAKTDLPEAELVESYGGRVEIIPNTDSISKRIIKTIGSQEQYFTGGYAYEE